MRKQSAIGVFLFTLTATLLAGSRPEFDSFAAAKPARAVDASSLAKRAGSTIKPGFRMQVEPRLGVPTFIWANPAVAATHTGIVARATAGEGREAAAARGHLEAYAPLFGLSDLDVSSAVVSQVHDTGKGGVIVKFRQQIDGIDIFREETNVLMTRGLDVVAISGYISSISTAPAEGGLSFVVDARNAATNAVQDLTFAGISANNLVYARSADGYDFYQFAAIDGVTPVEPVRVKKVYYHGAAGLEPGYYVEVIARTPGHATLDGYELEGYSYVISAIDGRALFRHDLIADAQAPATKHMQSNAGLPPGGFTYRVWADPTTGIPYDEPSGNGVHPKIVASPDGAQYPFVAPNDVTLPNYPFSMNDPWLAPGATETVGNNADAYMDLFNADGYGPAAAPADPATGDFRAQITAAGQFLHTHTPDATPTLAEARQGSVQQMFYNVNFLHDWYYDAGFNEAAGNAQLSNFGRGGAQNDRLKAEGQDVSGRNNANMLTPADGVSPRMQMYLFDTNAIKFFDVLSPVSAAGQRTNVGTGQFGPQVFDITQQVFQPNPANGCTAGSFIGASGKIVLVDREPTATCSIGTKLNNAMAAGAAGFVLVNLSTSPNTSVNVTGSLPSFTIPFLSITWNDAVTIKTALAVPSVVSARMRRDAGVDRDGTIDNQVMFHEWGHYLSNRLIGNSAGLITGQSGGMGEGWGDFSAMMLTVRADDTATPSNATWNGAYALATYVTSGGANNGYYYGIRRVPYSTDMTKNPLTLKHIANGNPLPAGPSYNGGFDGTNNAEVHNTGEVWATMLWECYAALLRDTQGTSPRLTFNDAQDRMKQYLVAGMKLTPLAPTFIEARDAMLAAAYANDVTDYVEFWSAFAKRGAGVAASTPDRFTRDNNPVTEDFTAPAEVAFSSASLTDSIASCDNDGVLDSGENGQLTITLKNIGNGAVAGLTGSVSSTTPGVTLPSGAAITFPDADILGTTTTSIPVRLAFGLAGAQQLDFQIDFSSPNLPGGTHSASYSIRGNTNGIPASTATDTVEASGTQWTATTFPPTVVSAGTIYTWGYPQQFVRKTVSAMQHLWHVDDIGLWQDSRLTSPVFTVDGSGAFNMQFDHSFGFEFDAGGNYDGGVVELSVNGGAFTDLGTAAYNGVILNYGGANNPNPLKGRNGFVQNSGGTIHTSLTQAIAPGSTVQVRFRVGADGGFGAAGWDIDNIAFTGVVETPFTTLVADSGCSLATTTTLSTSANPSPSGSLLTLTANVTSVGGAPNDGTVTFLDGGSPIGSGSVSAGVATYSTTSLSVGSHSLSARFDGATGYLQSTSAPTIQTIGKAATTTTLNASTVRTYFGRPVMYTATVTASATPSGSVTFYDGANAIGTVSLTGGAAAFSTSSLATGSHNITAVYGGNGTFAGSTSAIVVSLVDTQRADLSGEGRSDLALQNSSTNTVAAWLMNGSSISAAGNVATPTSDWKLVSTGDFDGDGKADLLLQNSTTGGFAEWRMNGLAMLSGSNITLSSNTALRVVGTYDFNHDGKSDIVLQNMATYAVAIWQMNGATIAAAGNVATTASTVRAIATGNIGGDAIVLQNSANGSVTRWLINGFTLSNGTVIGTAATSKLVATGDFNSDGVSDLVFQSTTTNAVAVWRLNSSAAITGSIAIATPVSTVSVLGTGDYDGDGRSEIVLQNSANNQISMWQTDGVTLLSGAAVATPVAGWKPVVN